MPKIKCESTFGFFAYAIEATVTDEQAEILRNAGALQVYQRSPATAAEKVMAGYEKRPDGFKRSSIPFNDGNAETLRQMLSKPVEIADDVEIKADKVTVKYHPLGEGVEPKYVDEKKAIAKHIEAKDIVTWATDKVGYTGEGDLDVNNVEFLKAVKAFKQRLLAAGM